MIRSVSFCAILIGIAAVSVCACEHAYPEVVVVNQLGERMLMKDISLLGCQWSEVLGPEQYTSSQRCLPGAGQVAFKRLNVVQFCENQARYGLLDKLCMCDGGVVVPVDDEDKQNAQWTNRNPVWFNYRTIQSYQLHYGEFVRIEVHLDELEQDFSVPGPYGH